jgi:hypothetical protein
LPSAKILRQQVRQVVLVLEIKINKIAPGEILFHSKIEFNLSLPPASEYSLNILGAGLTACKNFVAATPELLTLRALVTRTSLPSNMISSSNN